MFIVLIVIYFKTNIPIKVVERLRVISVHHVRIFKFKGKDNYFFSIIFFLKEEGSSGFSVN